MVKFRFHRGSLEESLKTEVEVTSKSNLEKVINESGVLLYGVSKEALIINHYAFHDVLKKDVYTVSVYGVGVIGWTDGELF